RRLAGEVRHRGAESDPRRLHPGVPVARPRPARSEGGHVKRRVWTNLAFFAVLFVVMIGWLTQRVISFKSLDHPYAMAAEFTNAVGVLPNAEVTYLGVTYGRVSKVTRITGGVRIDMEIDRGRRIPEGADATIFRKSAIGEQYVDFDAPAQPTTKW